MIYTITFNPSLDYIIQVDHFQTGKINKIKQAIILPGGKGINVSIVLANLHHPSIAFGFLAGFTGKEIATRLKSYGCDCQFIEVKNGQSRINVKMKSDNETEINGQGPMITKADIDALFLQLQQIQDHDILVISGSIPACLPDDIYEQIMQLCEHKKIKIIVDATNNLLMKVLKYHPFLIKPNHLELGEIFHVDLKTPNEVIPYALKLQALGAKNVLVSMASLGAVLVDEDGHIHTCDAPKGNVINSVGAGDSMVAGFISGYLETKDYQKALEKGVYAGSASAFCDHLATFQDLIELQKHTKR